MPFSHDACRYSSVYIWGYIWLSVPTNNIYRAHINDVFAEYIINTGRRRVDGMHEWTNDVSDAVSVMPGSEDNQ